MVYLQKEYTTFYFTLMINLLTKILPFITVVLISTSISFSQPLFQTIPPEKSGITVRNDVIENQRFNYGYIMQIYMGGGVAIGDIDNDGLPDVVLANIFQPNKIYKNNGNFQFEDITTKAGLIQNDTLLFMGVSMFDIDNDSDLDLYFCTIAGKNQLYLNNGDGTFKEVAEQFGLAGEGLSMQIALLDYDLDGDLDIYLVVNGTTRISAYINPGNPDKFYRNDGGGRFTEVSKSIGIDDKGYSLSASVGDLNMDGYPDIFVANDFEEPDLIYINNRNGTFSRREKSMLRNSALLGMGSDISDFNNDLLPDIISVDMLMDSHQRRLTQITSLSQYGPYFDSTQIMRNCLNLNRGNGKFSDVCFIAGVAATDWSWASFFTDFNNDAKKDLIIVNGYKRDVNDLDVNRFIKQGEQYYNLHEKLPVVLMQNYVFENMGGLRFQNRIEDWGLIHKVNSNGAAVGDLDLDGDLDLIVMVIDSFPLVYKNMTVEQNKNSNFLRLKFEGNIQNKLGVGTKVTIFHNAQQQMQEHYQNRGYISCSENIMHFGLGSDKVVDSMYVDWIGHKREVFRNIPANQIMSVSEVNALLPTPKYRQNPAPIIRELPSGVLKYTHKENFFDDFKRERLLPNRLSINGPSVAVGDVNGDGFDDVFIAGPKYKSGELHLQASNGNFTLSSQQVFDIDKDAEDQGAIFFDSDNDGDLDLYVASGGNETNIDDEYFQDRLYINNGKGQFTKSKNLPKNLTSTSTVVACDYDSDGDLDLFVGGRLIPGQYPFAPKSYILENTKGVFKDVTAKVCPALSSAGMVTSALWTDYDNDGISDLVLTGEWTTIRFFKNNGKTLTETTKQTGSDNLFGWWNSITGTDLDNDGDIDYVVGNMGLNTWYKASVTEPMECFTKDFDNNTSLDIILTYYQKGKRYPIVGKQQFTNQIPSYNARYTTFHKFANETIEQIFTPEQLASSYQLKVTTLESIILRNNGNGTFTKEALPEIAQISPIYGILTEDFNEDGYVDIIVAGNFSGAAPDMVHYHAGLGSLLLNDKKGGFIPQEPNESGVNLAGNVRAMSMVHSKSTNSLVGIIGNNSNHLQIIEKNLQNTSSKINTIASNLKATKAVLTFKNGKKRIHEFYIGNGFLSQQAPFILSTADCISIDLFSGSKLLQTITTK